MDGPIGAGGPDVAANAGAPSTKLRPKLKLAPRSKPAGATDPAATGGADSAPASAKKASIFGGGRAHDEFAYEVRFGFVLSLFCLKRAMIEVEQYCLL